MWWDVAIDVLMPTGGRGSDDRIAGSGADRIAVQSGVPGAFTRPGLAS
jgi:hypothetical protein